MHIQPWYVRAKSQYIVRAKSPNKKSKQKRVCMLLVPQSKHALSEWPPPHRSSYLFFCTSSSIPSWMMNKSNI